MRLKHTFPIAAAVVAITAPVHAEDELVPDHIGALVLDSGRAPLPKPDPGEVRFAAHGEAQLRGQVERSFPLDVAASTLDKHPGAYADSIGQNAFVTSWVRVTPKLLIGDKLSVTAQIDLMQGYVFGDTAHDVSADAYPRDNGGNAGSYAALRWLYLDWRTQYGLLRVGQQPNHWGMGLLANDGDHPSLFGDYRGGAMAERILFGTKPWGEHSPFTIALAGDLVYRDWQARLSRGDIAWQGVLAAYYEKGYDQLGIFSVLRSQSTSKQSGYDFNPYSDNLNVGIVDIAGKFARPVPGSPSTFIFGAAEVAVVAGSTNMLRSPDQAAAGADSHISQYGGAVSLGVVREAHCSKCTLSRSPIDRPDAQTGTWGSFVANIELGYASGDADPYADTTHRFTFDPNHKVGLVLFDEVLRWQTARASTAAQDPLLANGNRPTPGVNLLPSNGGVFGAQYIYPTIIMRPLPTLDLKAGAVIAQTTADNVDPYRVATQGAYVNYLGGDARRHDLGIELDGGAEYRMKLDRGLTLQLGAQAGILFPGGALADASGHVMKAPWLTAGRVGLQY
jgi:hypothetical protein